MYSYLELFDSQWLFANKLTMKVILSFLAMFFSVRFLSKKRISRKEQLVEMFPGIRKYGVLGSIPEMLFFALYPEKKILGWKKELAKVHGPIFKYWLFKEPIITIADAEIALKLYNENGLMDKPTCVTDAAIVMEGEGLVACRADIHKTRRKQWMPSFTRKQIEKSIKIFQKQSVLFCDELEKFEKTGETFDVVDMTVNRTFKAICYSAFGEEYMSRLPESLSKEYVHDLHTAAVNLIARMYQPWLSNDFIYFNLTRSGRETIKSVKRANLITKQAFVERQKYLKSSNNNEYRENECFLDDMLELMGSGHLTEKEVLHELNVFIAAGYDTTGISICYVLYLLSIHPEHQEKIVEELCQVVPQEYWNSINDYDISPMDIKQFKYLELCIKEALRLYPIVSVAPRRTTHDVKLADGRILPGEVDVFVMLYVIQRDPKYFKEPDKFIPERHLETNPAFMPFASGRRNCIGQMYAMYGMKTVLANLLMSYKWESKEKGDLKTIFLGLLIPEKGVHFKITKREFLANC